LIPFIKGALMGAAFGVVLYKVGATRYSRIMGMLTLRDTKIMKFAFVALASASILYGLAAAFGVAEGWNLVPRTMAFLGPAHLVGGVMFGAALGTTGLCPGTCVAKAGGRGGDKKFLGVTAILGLALGAVVFATIKDPLTDVGVIAATQRPLTLYGVLGLPYAAVALAFGAVILAVVLLVDRVTPEKKFDPSRERRSVLDYVRGEWSFAAAGVVGGLLVVLATLQGGYIGFSGAALAFVGSVAHLLGIGFGPVPVVNDDIIWRAALMVGVLPGGLLAHLASLPSKEAALHPAPKVLDIRAIAKTLAASTTMSLGAMIGGGCTTGAFIAGWPTLSLGSFAMGLTFFATSMAVSNVRIWLRDLDLAAAQQSGDRVYD
jgi:uncharacterized protein